MKTIAETLGVSRSNLIEQVQHRGHAGGPIATPMTPGSL